MSTVASQVVEVLPFRGDKSSSRWYPKQPKGLSRGLIEPSRTKQEGLVGQSYRANRCSTTSLNNCLVLCKKGGNGLWGLLLGTTVGTTIGIHSPLPY